MSSVSQRYYKNNKFSYKQKVKSTNAFFFRVTLVTLVNLEIAYLYYFYKIIDRNF